MKTQAAILVETGKPLVVADIEVPPLKPGQVLVELAFSGACRTQVMEVRGDKGEDKWLPHCLGHEGTGAVLETGPSVTRAKPGDKVVLSWIKGGGIEAGGTTYQWNGRTVNAGGVTTFQRHAIVSENRLTPLPGQLDLDVGVLLGCAAPTGMGAIINATRVTAGDAVAVFGTGGIGLSSCLAAAVAGATPIIGIDPNPARRKLAERYGATHVLDPAEADVISEIGSIAPGGVDIAVEATGLPEVMSEAIRAVRVRGGRAIVIGNAPVGAALTLDPGLFNQGKSLLGTWGGNSEPDRDYPRFARLLADGRFPAKGLLSEAYRLDEINTAIDDLESGRTGRPLIDMALR